MTTENFEREIAFVPAFDKRHADPNKNYGIHCVEIFFYLKGKRGVVQFQMYTGWYLPEIAVGPNDMRPYAADLGRHSPKPMYENETPLVDNCELLGGKPCYYDGSTLNARPIMDLLIRKGHEAVWEALEKYYHEIFDTERD